MVMQMKKALIDSTNKVTNVIEIEEGAAYAPSPGLRLINTDASDAQIGGTWDEVAETFTAAPEPVRSTLSILHEKLRFGEISQPEIETMLRLERGLTGGPSDARPQG